MNSLFMFDRFLFETTININPDKVIYDLKQATSFGEIQEIGYKLKQIGDGTTRNVYDLGRNLVLKLAKYPNNSISNLKEVDSYQCLGKEYAAQIVDFDTENYYWLVMERVKTITAREFQSKLTELIGFPLTPEDIASRFKTVISKEVYVVGGYYYLPQVLQPGRYHSGTERGRGLRQLHGLLCGHSSWFKEFNNRLVKCRIMAGDLGFGNFGLRLSTDELVLLDYGFEMIEGDQIECHS
jgi:hypothetical protein